MSSRGRSAMLDPEIDLGRYPCDGRPQRRRSRGPASRGARGREGILSSSRLGPPAPAGPFPGGGADAVHQLGRGAQSCGAREAPSGSGPTSVRRETDFRVAPRSPAGSVRAGRLTQMHRVKRPSARRLGGDDHRYAGTVGVVADLHPMAASCVVTHTEYASDLQRPEGRNPLERSRNEFTVADNPCVRETLSPSVTVVAATSWHGSWHELRFNRGSSDGHEAFRCGP
jgi:hypothetical protein